MTGLSSRSRLAVHVVLALLLVALVAPFVVYAVPEVVGANESYIVLTGSMSPEIMPGDAVVVRELPANQVRVGDVITFMPRNGGDVPVTHRVAKVLSLSDGSQAFVTKGDANEDADAGAVTPQQLVGKVVITLPYIGRVVAFVNSPVGFGVLVVLPIGLLILTEIGDVVLEGRQKRQAEREREPLSAAPDATAALAATPDGTLVLTRSDLTFTAIALVAFAVYAIYVAVSDVTPVSVATAVGVVSTLGLVVLLRQSSPPLHEAATEAQVPVADGGDEGTAVSSHSDDTSEVDA